MKIIKSNTREAVEILRVLASSTLVEKKVCMNIANYINKLSESDWKGKKLYTIEIPMKTLMARTTSNYEAIKRICKKMTSKTIQMKIPYKLKNGDTEIFDSTEVIFPSCGISENVFKIEVKETVMPLFSRALERYRHYDIIDAKFLTHKHSIEMYKFLKDYLNRKKGTSFQISVYKLKYELGIEKIYKAYQNFKLRVLEPVRKDLKLGSAIYFDYHEIKNGRAITDLKIDIFENKEMELNIYLSEHLKYYLENTTTDQFHIDYEIFLKKEYCVSKLSGLNYIQLEKSIQKLKLNKSLSDYPNNIQEQFISWKYSQVTSE